MRPWAAGGELAVENELAGDGGGVLPDERAVGSADDLEMLDGGGTMLVVGDDDVGVVHIERGQEGDAVGLLGFLRVVAAAAGAGEQLGDFVEIPTAVGLLDDFEARAVDGNVVDGQETEQDAGKPGVIELEDGNGEESACRPGEG